MTITVTVDKRSKKIIANLGNQEKLLKKSIKPALHEIGTIIGRENKHLITTGKRTGRVYNVSGRRHVASAFGEAPAKITGRLHKSYDYRVASWHTMILGEGADYAKFLEEGTRKMKPRQHLIRAINNKSGDAVRIFYRYAERQLGL